MKTRKITIKEKILVHQEFNKLLISDNKYLKQFAITNGFACNEATLISFWKAMKFFKNDREFALYNVEINEFINEIK